MAAALLTAGEAFGQIALPNAAKKVEGIPVNDVHSQLSGARVFKIVEPYLYFYNHHTSHYRNSHVRRLRHVPLLAPFARVLAVRLHRREAQSAKRPLRRPAVRWQRRCYTGTRSPNGSLRIGLFVTARIAFATAGASGGRPGSPTPLGGSLDGTMCTSTTGMSVIRSGK